MPDCADVVILLWAASVERGSRANRRTISPQAVELQVGKGEKGNTVVFAGRIMQTATEKALVEGFACAIPFVNAYCVQRRADRRLSKSFTREPEPTSGNTITRVEWVEAC